MINQSKFYLGELFITTGAQQALRKTHQQPHFFLQLHADGKWGYLDVEDKQANEQAVQTTGRVLSVYYTKWHGRKLDKLYVITEADRSATTLLLADEY
jgi:hypothetical protein